MKTKVICLFGCFNPVHYGHLYVATQSMKKCGFDEAWFILSHLNPIVEKEICSYEDRLNMLRLATGENIRLYVSTVEQNMLPFAYTYHSMQNLQNAYPEVEFSILMGTDNFLSLPYWEYGSELVAEYNIYVFSRDVLNEEQRESVEKHFKKHNFHYLEDRPLNISSTMLRKNIQSNSSIDYLTHPSVVNYIQRNKLYSHDVNKR